MSRTDQKILEIFLRDGYFERHLNRMRALYKAKHDLLLRQLKAFQDICTVSGEHAGVHVLLKLNNGLSGEQGGTSGCPGWNTGVLPERLLYR